MSEAATDAAARRFAGGLLMAAGALIVGLCGGCTLVMALTGGVLGFAMGSLFGGAPAVAGAFVFAWGARLTFRRPTTPDASGRLRPRSLASFVGIGAGLLIVILFLAWAGSNVFHLLNPRSLHDPQGMNRVGAFLAAVIGAAGVAAGAAVMEIARRSR